MNSTQRTEEPVPADSDLELLSAWLDGELEAAQAGAMVDRLKGDAMLRVHFEAFSVAGDAMRSQEVAACHVAELASRVRRALDAEPTRLSPGALAGSQLRRHVATGVGVAAAAAMLAVVVLPQLRGSEMASPQTGSPIAATEPVANKGAPKHSVPNTLAARSTLDAYFRAHRELAATGVMPSAVAYIRSSGEPDR